jgi:beta-galactosidase
MPSLTRSGLRLGEREIPLRSGAVHYWRLAPTRWRRALESLRELGLGMVETYVPWGVHEIAKGQFDFGQHDPQKDLGAFIDLAHELGLSVFLRPGPNINAEMPYFGLPRRVVLDPENQARSPRGRPLPLAAPPRMFAAPSYASRNFLSEVEVWFRAFGAVAAPRRWPAGPVVLLQVDNEAAFFFRDAPYDSDYHPDALSAFARFLERSHATIDALNAAYGTAYESFDQVPAPRRFSATTHAELPPYLDWVAFHEALLAGALSQMSKQLVAAGLSGLPTVHNLPMGDGGLPTTLHALGRAVDLVGLDYYHNRGGLTHARRRTTKLATSARIAYAPELGVGAPPWFAARSEIDSVQGALAGCAYGLRGFNLYMAVDRDRWYGAPIDADGVLRATAEPWRRLLAALDRTAFQTLERRAEIALSVPKHYARLSRATHTMGAISPNLLDLAGMPASSAARMHRFGFEQPIQLAWEPLLARLEDGLSREQVAFTYVESDADLTAIAGLRVVFVPSFEFADPEHWQRLQRFADRGGAVIWGPMLPRLDTRMQPHRFQPIGERPPLRIGDEIDTRALVRELVNELGIPRRFAVQPYPLHSVVHEDSRGARVIFLINPGNTELQAEMELPAPMRFADALTGEQLEGEVSLTFSITAETCRMLIVEMPAHDQ